MSEGKSSPVTQNMHILFLYRNYGHGGTETLIMRMANWLSKTGIQTTLLLGRLEVRHVDVPKCSVLVIGETLYDRLIQPRVLSSVLKENHLSGITHIYTCDGSTLPLALLIAARTRRSIRVLAGCYFPWGFLYPRWSWNYSSRPQWERGPFKFIWKSLAAYTFDKCIPDRNKIFTVKAIRDKHEKSFGRALRESHVWFVPLDFSIFKMTARRPIKGRIVSIGRLCESKAYNRYMIDVVQDLASQGLDVQWSVFGYGELWDELKSIVQTRNLSQRIHFEGVIDYQDIPSAVQEAYVFVGTGTTIMEAGWCGLVCIPTIENYPQSLTYGYLHEFPDVAAGVELDRPPERDIGGLIKDVFLWPEKEYARICALTRDVVAQFDCERHMPEFIRICEAADPIKLGRKERLAVMAQRLLSKAWRWSRAISRARIS
jgi:glycosyltransferase involved in cell wall biosynthesis